MSGEDLRVPRFEYHLDGSNPGVVVLRRPDDAFITAFSAKSVTRQGILEAAKEDYRELIQIHAKSLAQASEEHRSATYFTKFVEEEVCTRFPLPE